jgi:hypothetical protein
VDYKDEDLEAQEARGGDLVPAPERNCSQVSVVDHFWLLLVLSGEFF